jgi:hypothetical protein
MYCKNCKTEFNGNYCYNCGQRAVKMRPVLKNIFKDTVDNYITLDKGLFYLVVELFKRPGELAADYISGERKKYFNPVKFIFLIVAIATFVTIRYKLLGPKGGVMNTEALFDLPDYDNLYSEFIYRFFNIIRLISVPLLALVTYLLFKKSNYNYTENIILNCFVLGERILIYILFTPLYILFREHWGDSRRSLSVYCIGIHGMGLYSIFQTPE